MMSQKKLRIATRKSPLALWQAEFVRTKLLTHWPDLSIDLLPLQTSGDTFLKDKLLAQGGKGLFVKELEEALLDGRADLAVHSMKDVPALLPAGLCIEAICERDNPFDAFVSLRYPDIASLPLQARIGTSSARRQSQLLIMRPDLQIHTLRGNIQTRLQKLQDGLFEGIILAAAGLERMNIATSVKQLLTPTEMLPACGQGALGVECRREDTDIHRWLSAIHHPTTAQCVWAERRVNALLGGNCHVPLAVYCALLADNQCQIIAKIFNADGKIQLANTQIGALQESLSLAQQCAEQLILDGALTLLQTEAP